MRGFDGSIVIGITKWGATHDPTFPTMFNEPLAILSMVVLEMKPENGAHERELEKILGGGRLLLYLSPSKVHRKGIKNSVTSTP